MLKQFLQLEWLAFIRAGNFKANLILKIILGIFAGFYALCFLVMGPAVYMGLKESNMDPISTVSGYLVYYLAADLFLRYYMQKSPVVSIRPLLVQGIKRHQIVNFALGKTFVSFFTWVGAMFWVPFTVTALFYEPNKIGTLAWMICIWMCIYILNLFNVLLNDANKWIIAFAVLITAAGICDYQGVFSLSELTAPVFESVYHYPVAVIVPIGLFIGLLLYTKSYFAKRMYLDIGLKAEKQTANEINLSILERSGFIGTLIKNDLYLLLRNKRAKNAMLMSFFFLFYGFLFFSNFGDETYGENSMMKIFAGVFVTGGFIFLFGQFVPSWDSSYYPLMMTQKIPYRTYLEAKWWLMVVATIVLTVLSVFYWFIYGWEVYKIILAATVFNIGMNSHMVLLSGAFVKTPIDLTKGQAAFGNTQSFNIATILLSLPKLALPVLLYGIGIVMGNNDLGLLLVAGAGVLGFFGRNWIFDRIVRLYRKRKYETLEAYKQKV